MERERIYRKSEMIQKKIQSSSPFWVSSSSSPSILGSDHVVHFTATRVQPTPDVHFFRANDGGDDTGSDDFDGGSHHQPKKKRRLTVEQVQYLERSFEKENKLDPERKVELAKELGLQPRQVAIWFQNRRARYKTKRLEKDYDSLKASFDRLKLDFNSLAQEKENLQNVVTMLKNKLKEREKEKDGLNPEPNVPIDSDLQNRPDNAKLGPETIPKSTMASKPDPEANSAKSDVIDSENPHYIDANHYSLSLEPANSSHAFEPELSDEEDHRDLARSILLPTTTTVTTTTMGCILPKLEEGCYPDPSWNVCNLGNGDQDQHFWSWLC